MKKPNYKLPLKEYVQKVRLEEFLWRKYKQESKEKTNKENNLKVNKTLEPQRERE
ncbi:MAG: hypothetical protein PHX01_02345 [Clostridia bacterium]|nr:hypothetical protein [Clostridia bacterium]